MTDFRFSFTADADQPLTPERAVYEAIGAASMCWDPMDATGVFRADWAKQIGEALLEWLGGLFAGAAAAGAATGADAHEDTRTKLRQANAELAEFRNLQAARGAGHA